MDGLLGIGAAGGNTGSKANANEGAMLAARLKTMRKERDERAKVIEKTPVAAAPVTAPQPNNEVAMVEDGESPNQGRRRNPSKNKKKKKKKSRK